MKTTITINGRELTIQRGRKNKTAKLSVKAAKAFNYFLLAALDA